MHRALDGAGPIPLEWFISRLCEEFHCLPSAAWREYLSAPAGLMETILAFRAYSRAKAYYDAKGSSRPVVPLVDLVTDIDFELVAADLDDRP